MRYVTKIAAAAIVIGCFLQATCGAAESYNIDYDTNEKKVTISGKTEQANSPVTLVLLKEGEKSDVLKNLSIADASNTILRYDQVLSDGERNFSFCFKLPADSETGNYVVRIAWGGSATDGSLVYISPNDFENALNDINNATTPADMISAIDNCIHYFGIDNPYYAGLSETEKTFIAKKVLNGIGVSGYDSASAVAVVFSEAMAIAAVNEILSGNDAIETTNYFENILKLKDLVSYKTFEVQTDALKKSIIQTIAAEGRVEELTDYHKRFEEKTVIMSLNNLQGYEGVQTILQDNNHLLNIDFTDYGKLVNKSTVNKKMISAKYNSVAEIVAAFNGYVQAEKRAEQNNYSNNVSGGGGGAGGGTLPNITSGWNVSGALDGISGYAGDKTFNDLSDAEWARKSIERLAQRGIVSGKGNNNFEPMAAVTRAEFIKMLVATIGIEIEENGTECSFDDVPESAWYYPYVAAAVKNQLTRGISESVFGSDEKIIRQDMATLIVRAAELKNLDFNGLQGKIFNDETEISEYAAESVKKLSAIGVISGTDTGNFEPKKSATRAEAAVMLVKFLDLMEDR